MIALLYFFSGATALLYQLAWTRRLVLAVGNTHLSVTTLLFSFMLGLGLGAHWAGRRLARGSDARRLYAGAEIALGVLAALVPFAAGWLESGLAALPGAWGAGAWLRFAAAAAVLLPPCFCMGVTFPAVCVLAVRRRERAGRAIAWLNGVNIAGAATGAALTGFVLIPELGLRASIWAAAGVNLLLGVLALAVLRPAHDRFPKVEDSTREEKPRLGGILVIAASSAAVLAFEVLWTRMLVFHLKGFTYTFTAILVVFLVGLSLGSLVIAPWLGRWVRGRVAFGFAALLAAAVSVSAIDFLVTGGARLEDLSGELRDSGTLGQMLFLFLAALWAVGPAVLCLGLLFPLGFDAWLPSRGSLGRAGAKLYLASSLGSAVGAGVAGLILVPSLGMVRGAWAIVGGLIVIGLAVLLTHRHRWAPAWAVAGAVAVGAWVAPRFDWSPAPYVAGTPVLRETRVGQYELLDYREGTACAVSVLEDRATGRRLLYTDEFMAAATGEGYRYMRMMGHLPALLAEAPRRALLIAFGTGTTAGSLVAHDELERLDVVEISEEVLEVADYFIESNRGVLSGGAPFEVEAHVQDGRQFLLASEESFDVITLEPLLPFTPAAVHFYTREFYELCRQRLTEDGVLCHWIPIHAIEPGAYRTLLATFCDVFPEGAVWVFENSSLLVGTLDPLVVRTAPFRERARRPGVAADLAAALAPRPEHVLGGFVTTSARLRELLGTTPVMRDDRTTVEYGMWWPGRESYAYHAANVALLLEAAAGSELRFVPPADEDAESGSFAQAVRASRGARLLTLQQAGASAAARGRGAASENAEALLASAVQLAPDDPWPLHQLEELQFEQLWLAGVARSKVDPRGARELLARAVALRPDHAVAPLWLAEVTRSLGDRSAARLVLAQGLERFDGWQQWGTTRQFLESHPDLQPLFDELSSRGPASPERSPSSPVLSWLTAFANGRARLASAPADALDQLIDIACDEDEPVALRAAAFDALAKLGETQALEAIAETARTLEGELLLAAWRAVGRLDEARLVAILESVLAGDHSERENRAMELIAELELRPLVPHLIRQLDAPSESQRLQASVVLFQMTGQQLGYDFEASAEARRAAIVRWQEWWASRSQPGPSKPDDGKDSR